jgi:hypothetical protein
MNYNQKYLKYKNKYLILSNKLNGGALVHTPLDNNIIIVRPNGDVINTLTNVIRGIDGKYDISSLQFYCSMIKDSNPFKIVTSSCIEIYCSLYQPNLRHLGYSIEISDNKLTFVSLNYTPRMLNVFDSMIFPRGASYINYELLRDVFNEYPDLIWDKNYILYLLFDNNLSLKDIKLRLVEILGIIIQRNPQNPDVELQNNKNFWRFIVQLEHDFYSDSYDMSSGFSVASEALLRDDDFIKELLKISPHMLKFASTKIKDDILIKPYILDNPKFLKDYNISDRLAFQIASESNTDQIKNLLEKYGLWLKYLPENLKKDKNLILLALNNNISYLRFIDSSLKSDKNYLKDIFIKFINNNRKYHNYGEAIDTIDDMIQSDPSFYLEIYNGLDFSINKDSKIVNFLKLIKNETVKKDPQVKKLIIELEKNAGIN